MYFFFVDLNLYLIKHGNDNVQEFINIMYNYLLLPITTLPTRVTDTSSTATDQIWT